MATPQTPKTSVHFKDYIDRAVLHPVKLLGVPSRPPPGEKSKIKTLHRTNIRLGWRPLRGMERLQNAFLLEKILNYYQGLSDRSSSIVVCPSDRACLTVPAPGIVDLPPTSFMHGTIYDIGSAFDVTRTASQTALKTATTLLHQIDERTREWTFQQKATREDDLRSFDPFSFAKWTISDDIQQDARFAVIVLAPWAFSSADFAEFVALSRLPQWASEASFRVMADDRATTAMLLWAMMFDFCYHNKCHYWAVTTYEEWAFGAFSEKFRIGWTTDVFDLNARGPTALQALVFWLHSAFGGTGTWEIPKVEQDNLVLSDPVYEPHAIFRKRPAEPDSSADEFSESEDEATGATHAYRSFHTSGAPPVPKRVCRTRPSEPLVNNAALAGEPAWDVDAFLRDFHPAHPGLMNPYAMERSGRNSGEAIRVGNFIYNLNAAHGQPFIVPVDANPLSGEDNVFAAMVNNMVYDMVSNLSQSHVSLPQPDDASDRTPSSISHELPDDGLFGYTSEDLSSPVFSIDTVQHTDLQNFNHFGLLPSENPNDQEPSSQEDQNVFALFKTVYSAATSYAESYVENAMQSVDSDT